MKNLKLTTLVVLFLLSVHFASAETASTSAKTKFAAAPKPADYLKIFYYRNGKNAKASFSKNLKLIDVVAPQSYSLTANGKLSGKIDSAVLALARKNKIKVMPLVTNGNFNATTSAKLLADAAKQDAAIAALIAEGKKQKFWGWQFDFEGMPASSRDAYSAFIKKASAALRWNDFTVSVAVVAQISENPGDYQKDLWNRVIGVYDYGALATSANFISIMSYDDPDSKGPVTRYSWLTQVLAHALQLIPNEKLSMGIPLYYWKWDDAAGKLVGIGGYSGIKNTLQTKKVQTGYSTEEQAPFIRYTSNKKQYTIWYENAASVAKKLELVSKYDLLGFSAWVLGSESPDAFNSLKK